jgi:putative two-component system response regulator
MIQDVDIHQAKILIIDDEEANIRLLDVLLRHAGYCHLKSTSDSRQVLSLFMEYEPDLILLDLQMPYLDGHAILRQIGSRVPPDSFLPILVLTADIEPSSRQRALSGGAKDFLIKPFDRTEVLLRIRNLLETRVLHRQIQNHNQVLESKVRERTQELEGTQIEILERLAFAAEFRDDDTGDHTRRMGDSSALIARALGKPESWVELLRRAAPLHDVGKIGIPDSILLKPAKLTDCEFDVMRTHVHIGASILSGSRSPALQMAEAVALTHHERWDGTGYARLKGEAIPLEGRIVSVADVFDALTHARPYKKAWNIEDSVEEIRKQSGRHFDPVIVDAFLTALPEILVMNELDRGSRTAPAKGRMGLVVQEHVVLPDPVLTSTNP